MIALAGFIYLPLKFILVAGLIIVFGHNLLDGIHFKNVFWSALHEPRVFRINDSHLIRFTYPVLPWIGIMLLGYCFGRLYTKEFTAELRKKWLLIIGTTATALFIILRAINIYGDPESWSTQNSSTFTFLSFLNTTKYPPSLLYTLMTL